MAALKTLHVEEGWTTEAFTNPSITRLLDGIKRTTYALRPPKPKTPITPDILNQFKQHLDLKKQDDAVFFAACCLGTYGLLRAAEFLVQPIQMKQIRLVHDGQFTIHLPRSKSDSFGKGVDIQIYANNSPSCPVKHVIKRYMEKFRLSAQPNDPLLVREGGITVTRAWILAKMKRIANKLGMDPATFSGHGFRKGGATALARAGVQDSLIKSIGRWKSSAYHRYITHSNKRLAKASGAMARNPPDL